MYLQRWPVSQIAADLDQAISATVGMHLVLDRVRYWETCVALRTTHSEAEVWLVRSPGRRLFWTRIAITAASGAPVAVLLVPLLAGAARPGPFVLVLPGAGPDGSTVSFDPRSLIDMPAAWGEKPLDQPIPVKTLPGQRAAPCDTGIGQEEINGNCWAWMGAVKPPCGRLFRRGDKCYAPVAEPKKPAP